MCIKDKRKKHMELVYFYNATCVLKGFSLIDHDSNMLEDLSSIQRESLLKTKKVSSGATSLWMIDRKSSRDITSPKVLSQAIQREPIYLTPYANKDTR